MAVSCPSCGTEAAPGARFCSACGAALTAGCPACGADADPGARFCSACGTPLTAAEHAGPEGTAAEERKVVSVLFCDLAGFTAHTEASDPEDVRARLTAYHTRVRQDVERFGGRVEKLMGDGVFAVFGVPVAHEDDPERAVRAALRILESVEELNTAQPDLALVVRTAVTTGEAIVSLDDRPDREGIVGDVVNTASRLEGIAAPGTVVCDERTFHAARAAIDFAALDPVSVKGKAAPVPIWRAYGPRSRFGVAADDQAGTPFVGRDEELALLVDAFERTVARRTTLTVTIVGEPGVGKSRLVREFRGRIDDRPELVWWRQGRCLPYGEGVAFWAIGELVKAQAGILDSEPPDVAAAKLAEAVRVLVDDPADAAWITLRLRPLVGLGGAEGAERSELFAAWLRFFAALATRNPLVLVVEDLHWADDGVVEFLDRLADWATDVPILVVATARPELMTDRPDWTAGRRDAVTVGLAPLTAEETSTLVAALADRPVIPVDLHRTLRERSGGNPLYVTEYVRLAVERGWFDRAARGEDLPLPDSVQAIIAARIDLLSTADKTLLQTAAVLGRVFWAAALSFAGAGSGDEVRRGLRRLVRRDLVRTVRRPSMQGQDEYVFSHVLIRDVAYRRLTRPERARLHEAAARWLEAVSGDRTADVAEQLAHHLGTAFELAPSDDPDRRRRLYRFLMLAAERAAAFDVRPARDYLGRALDVAAGDRERGRALTERARFSFDAPDDAEEALTEAVECFGRAGDLEGETRAIRLLARLVWHQGDAERTDRLDARALELAERLPPSPVVAEVMVGSAAKLQVRGREEEALDLVERGIAVARQVGDTRSYARGLAIRGACVTQMGDPSGLDDPEEALRIQLDLDDAQAAMSTFNTLATFYALRGRLTDGLERIEEAIDYGTRRGLTAEVTWSELTHCEILFPLGRWDDLVEAAEQALAAVDPADRSQPIAGLESWVAQTRFLQGDTDAGWAGWQAFIDRARRIRDPQMLVPALGLGVWFACAVGDEETSRRLAEEFAGFAADHPSFLTELLFVAAEPMVRFGMAATVRELAGRATRWATWPGPVLDGVEAILAAGDGDHAGAVERWRRMITAGDDVGHVVLATMARIGAARSAVALGDADLAETFLGPAEGACRQMGAGLLADQIAEIRRGPPSAAGG